MSNLIKSGFVAFSQNDKLVIDANESKIIKAINEKQEQIQLEEERRAASIEEALAEALIQDAELAGAGFEEGVLTMDMSDVSELGGSQEALQKVANEIIRSAKEEAEMIVDQAHDEVEKLRADAYEEAGLIKKQAHDEGYQSGYEKAISVAKKEIEEKQVEFEQYIEQVELQFEEKEKQLYKDVENRMVDLLCQLIPSVTGVVVGNQRDVLLYMINMAIQDLDNSKHFIIKVSSADYEDLVERKEEIYGALNPSIELEIFEDTKLTQKQCLIETDNGIVDVSLDVQLDNLIKALKLMIKE